MQASSKSVFSFVSSEPSFRCGSAPTGVCDTPHCIFDIPAKPPPVVFNDRKPFRSCQPVSARPALEIAVIMSDPLFQCGGVATTVCDAPHHIFDSPVKPHPTADREPFLLCPPMRTQHALGIPVECSEPLIQCGNAATTVCEAPHPIPIRSAKAHPLPRRKPFILNYFSCTCHMTDSHIVIAVSSIHCRSDPTVDWSMPHHTFRAPYGRCSVHRDRTFVFT